MEIVSLGQFINCLEDDLFSAWLTHWGGGVVGVATGTVPVTRNGLGIKGDNDAKVLGNAPQEETCHPKLIAHFNALAGSNLELPLGGHHLGVGAGNLNARVETGTVMRLDDVTPVDIVVANGTVVRALGTRVTLFWPAVRMTW